MALVQSQDIVLFIEFSNCVQNPAKSGAKPAMVDEDEVDVPLSSEDDKCKSKSISVQVLDDMACALILLQSTLIAFFPGQISHARQISFPYDAVQSQNLGWNNSRLVDVVVAAVDDTSAFVLEIALVQVSTKTQVSFCSMLLRV
jgi:hypothetical protein